jgi:hypothetical protein
MKGGGGFGDFVTPSNMAVSSVMFSKQLLSFMRRIRPLARQLGLFESTPTELHAMGLAPRLSAQTILKPKTRTPRAKTSDARLAAIWRELISQFFPERLDLFSYTIVWSTRRQRRTLASCNLKRSMVKVALELNRPDCEQWLRPLLYHELCHAVLGENIGRQGSKRAWHGREFRELERRHPDIPALDRWIKQGGWLHVVRSHRAQQAARLRRS